MRLFSLPVWLALAWACVGSWAATAKEKVAELEKRSSEDSVMMFTTSDYNKYLAGSNREYGVFVMFTATDPKFGCQACKPAMEMFQLTADSFRRKKSSEDRFYFAAFDFSASTQKVFFKYEIQSAPLLWYFPAKGKLTEGDKLGELQRKGPSPELFQKFVREKSGMEFVIKRPTNWVNVGIMVTVFGGLGTVIYLFLPVALLMRFAKPLLTIVAMACTLLYPTGYMWNQIRGAGWHSRGPNGEPEVWAKGTGNQTMTESWTLFMLHGALALSAILLINAPRFNISKPVSVSGGFFAVLCLGAMLALDSVDWYVYRIHKNGGYPYSLLL